MSQDKVSTDSVEDKQVQNNTESATDSAQNAADVEEALESQAADSTNGPDSDSDTSADVPADGDVPLSEVDALQQQLVEANEKASQSMDAVLRTRAEMENLRKRQSRELENAHKYALDKIAMELLPVRDTLEMGVAAATEEADMTKIVEGTELTLKMLTQALDKFNIVEVDPQGQKFDPDLHQAISVQEGTDKPANTVLNVMQKGYTLNERLLRPAMVVIAK